MSFRLVPCDRDGTPVQHDRDLPDALVTHCEAAANLYRRVGYAPPWISYVAVEDKRGVGGGAFVGAPKDGSVEIAYFTLAKECGKGYALRTASALVALARANDPRLGLKAFTLQEENASTSILRKLGFTVVGIAQDADAGDVWEWRM